LISAITGLSARAGTDAHRPLPGTAGRGSG
jgi:hypothetical protein